MITIRSTLFIALALAACGGKKSSPCPGSFLDFKDSAAAEHTCSCAASAATGAVYGTDVYTQDSSICAAAVHSGAGPGDVTVKSAPGCSTYAGTSKNGITTAGWGSYPGSFFFAGKGDGKCPTK